jgi:hypothetical protein
MLLKGKLAELMVQVDPLLYRKYVITSSKGEPMLYVRLSKALYGLLQSALLFYKKFVGDLKAYGFEVNPYDPCVANKMVNGSQMTVTWHVDDGKVSHKDSAEVSKFLIYLAGIYGPKLTVTRGHVHDYLGMDLDYSDPGKLKVAMIKYIKKILTDFPEAITSISATPAADHLFEVRDEENAKWLPEEQAQAFHHCVAQLLFLSARARPDIKTAVAFLTTRVSKPDEDDWGKLKRVLKYLKGTMYLKLTLSVADGLFIIKWWVDASFGVHWDSKGHTGMMMSLGKGAVMSFSRKQKLNTRSSTEAELVGIDDAIGEIMWGLFFMQAQGYDVARNILLQDNKSTILLATNGRWSSSKRTKHINNRYFLVKDKIDRGELEVEYDSTNRMWSDILTKPKQGVAFREFRGHLMNCPTDYDDEVERRNTHPKLLPKDEEEKVISENDRLVLRKAVTMLLVYRSMKRKTERSSSHRRSVLGEQQSRVRRRGRIQCR